MPVAVAAPASFRFSALALAGGSSVLRYALPREAFVSIRVYDLSGRLRWSAVNSTQGPGYYGVALPKSGFAATQSVLCFRAGDIVVRRLLPVLR
jgi:hypothetical protein